jgi:hypothetical protein
MPVIALLPEQPEFRIRTLLGEAGVGPALIDTSAQHVSPVASPAVTIDCLVVQQVWKQCRSHKHCAIDNCVLTVRSKEREIIKMQ